MKLKKLFALALAVCMMALAVPAAFAAGLTLDYGTTPTTPVVEEHTPVVYNTRTTSRAVDLADTEGLVTTKNVTTNTNGTYTVTLASHVTGSTITSTEEITTPLDIVLVLDQSSSMALTFAGKETTDNTARRQYAMKTAVNNFIGAVNEKYDATNSDHRMALVTFGSQAATLSDWTFVNASGKTTLQSSVDGLPTSPTGTATRIDHGMTAAQALMNDGSYTGANTDRAKVVIVFTDGVPTKIDGSAPGNATEDQAKEYGFQTDIADAALATSKALKANDVKVYTIGIFGGADVTQEHGAKADYAYDRLDQTCYGNPESYWGVSAVAQYYTANDFADWDVAAGNRFLNYLSSNFKEANVIGIKFDKYEDYPAIYKGNTGSSFPSFLDGILNFITSPLSGYIIKANATRTSADYYYTANNTSSLTGVFSEITKDYTSGGEDFSLGTDAVVEGVISEYFTITAASVHTEKYNQNGSWTNNNDTESIDHSGNKVSYSGFDFATNYVGIDSANGTPSAHGNRLVIDIIIKPKDSFFGGSGVPTTVASSTGIKNNQELIENFPEPILVDVPIKYAVGVGTDQTIYLSNGVNLAGCLDFNKKDGTGIFAEDYVPDGTNNAFVNIKYIINGSIYTLPAGKKDFGNASYWSGSSTQVTENVLKGCTPYTITCNVADAEDSTYVWSYEDSANIATATVHVLKPTVEAAETTTYISNTVSMPADTTEDNTVYDSHVTAWTDTTKDHDPAGVNVQPSIPDAAKLTWKFYDGETEVKEYTAINKECKELTAVLCINGNNYEKLYKNTYTVHVLTPNLKADSTKIYLGDDTNLYSRVSWKENWNNCTTHGSKTTANVPAGTEMPAADNVANCSFVDVSDPANYKNITCKALTAKWISGNYTTSAQFDVHVLWPTISVADDTIYLGDTSKLTASISGWICDKHEDATADGPTTGNFKFYDENDNEVKNLTVSPHDCAEYTAKLVLADQPISKSFWIHVLTAGVTVEDQVIYLSDSVTAKDATITWQNECDEHKCTVAAGEEPLSDTVVFSEDGNTTSVDACGSYTAYLKVGNTVYKEEKFKDSFDVHVLEPQIKADSFAMYLSNDVNLNERQYITEWKCSDKTEKNVTAGRVKPPVAYDFYQNIAGTAEENTSAYAPSEDVTLTVVVKVNSNEYSKKYQGTFAIDVLKPIFSVNQKEVWANYLSNVEVYTQYGNEVKSVAWDSTTYAIVGEKPENISCTFELEKIAGDGDWDKTDATKYQTGTNEDTFKVVKATWTYADGKSFVATDDRVKCNDLYDFVIHTNKFQLTIKTDWTESSGEQQSAIFTVTPDNTDLMPIKVVVPKGVNSVVVAGLFSGQEYTIAEDNGWTWRYGTAAEAVGGPNIYCAGGFSPVDLAEKDDVTMSFDSSKGYNAKWLADEDCVVNKATTQATITNPALSVKKKDEEVTNA